MRNKAQLRGEVRWVAALLLLAVAALTGCHQNSVAAEDEDAMPRLFGTGTVGAEATSPGLAGPALHSARRPHDRGGNRQADLLPVSGRHGLTRGM